MISLPGDLTEAQARAIIEPWYSMFTQPVRGDIAASPSLEMAPASPGGRDVSIKVIGSFATSIPDMKFEIKEVLVATDTGEARRTLPR